MQLDNNEMILKTFNAAIQSKKLYPPGHPSIAAPARKTHQLLTEFLAEKPKLIIAIIDEALVFDEVPIDEGETNYEDIYKNMSAKKIEAIIIEKGVTDKEIADLMDILPNEKEYKGNELNNELKSRGITHVTLKSALRSMVEVYNDAVDTVKNVMGEIRMGKIPNSTVVNSVMTEIRDWVLEDSNAMVGLSMIKNYDNYLYNHSVNVSILAIALGKHMKLSEDDMHILGVGSLLHDVGKTGVSEDIIKKPGGLSSEEFEKVKEHPELGNKISTRMKDIHENVSRIILEHHVRYDHSGYPKTVDNVHPLSMIVSVADAYDALTTLRVYQKPYQPVEAVKILKGLSGKHFAPDTIAAFEEMIGLYPVGSMVRLSTNEVGVVTEINPTSHDRPVLKVLYGADGAKLDEEVTMDLTEAAHKDTHIVGPVDPLSRNMDLGSFFEKEATDKEAV
jgi:putative nucleotidyltransferase with HDIG domain